VTEYGVTSTGFVKKPLSVILTEIAERQRSDIDPNWSAEADTLAGQYNGIFADAIAQLWEVLEDEYYALSRDAEEASLDVIGALTATARKNATKSTVVLTCNLNNGTVVPEGSIVSVNGDPSIRVVTTAVATGPGPGAANVDVEAEAETAGVIAANPGTLTVIETPVAGWNTVTNAEPLLGGDDIESDAVYRQRQLDEIAAGGGGSVPGVRADILAVSDDINAVLVLENDTEATVDGMPPKSIEVVVHGGDDLDQEIAEALFNSKSGGIYPHGSEGPFTVTDEQGLDHDVRFSRPTVMPIYMAVGLTTVSTALAFAAAVKTEIAHAAVTVDDPGYLSLGTDVYAARIVATVLGVSGVMNVQVGLSFSVITDPAAGSTSLPIADREIASILTTHISVSEL